MHAATKNATPSSQELLSTIQDLLGSNLHVTMTDGRVASGNFVCLDRLGNIILENVIERRKVAYIIPPNEPSTEGAEVANKEGSDKLKGSEQTIYKWDTERSLSQAVIPGDRLAKVEIAKEELVGDLSYVVGLIGSGKS